MSNPLSFMQIQAGTIFSPVTLVDNMTFYVATHLHISEGGWSPGYESTYGIGVRQGKYASVPMFDLL